MNLPVDFTLRPASIEDAPLFYQVTDRTMREFIIATWGKWDEARVQRESIENSSASNAQVIQVGDAEAGVFRVKRLPTHIDLEQIYLLPKYQKLGIGTALLNSLIAEAAQAGVPLRLRVLVVNPAKQLYERLGFAVTETTPDFFYMEKLP